MLRRSRRYARLTRSLLRTRSAPLRQGSRYVYVYTWVPILPHAPWFPFAIIATNNKFDNVYHPTDGTHSSEEAMYVHWPCS